MEESTQKEEPKGRFFALSCLFEGPVYEKSHILPVS